MRAIWSGAISFGLINIPVKLYSAAQGSSLDLDMLHEDDKAPVRYARICTAEEKEIPYSEIIKGFETEGGEYVILDKEDFAAASKKTRTIDIVSFAMEDEIDSKYFDTPYYLEPAKGAEKSYALFREALRSSKKVGVATFVMRNKEHPAVLKPDGDVIVLNQLRFAEEIREPDLQLPAKGTASARPKEIEMAVALIDQLTEPYAANAFHDTYTGDLKKVIAAKAKGKAPKAKKGKAPAAKTQDLASLLKASLERERTSSAPAAKAKKPRVKA